MAVLLFAVPVASASADTHYVDQAGAGTDCTLAQPCASIADALTAHRVAPTTADVIEVGAGVFVGNVQADDAADDGLVIRGTLDTDGTRLTTIRADGAGVTPCLSDPCGVVLGLGPDGAVALQDADVDTVGANSDVTAISMEGGSDLKNVHAILHAGADAPQVVISCDDPGTTIDRSTIDANGATGSSALVAQNGLEITDSLIRADDGPAIIQTNPVPADPLVLTRTHVEVPPGLPAPSIVSTGDFGLDSSLITGGAYGVFFQGSDGGDLYVDNSTIDIGSPGSYDSALPDLFIISVDGNPPVDVHVNSSILAEEITTFQPPGFEGPGSITCQYSDIAAVFVSPPMTDACDLGPGSTNTTTDSSLQFTGGSPFSWELAGGAPAIDAGDPGPLDPGLSTTDLAGNPRVQHGTLGTCPGGVRDMGAYEVPDTPCVPAVIHGPTVKRSTSAQVGVKLGGYAGQWANAPTSYAFQWVRCDADGASNCADISGKTNSVYTPVALDAGRTLRVRVEATNSDGTGVPATSPPTSVVMQAVPSSTSVPTIKGAASPSVGGKLGANPGAWTGLPTSYAFQWVRCDADGSSGCGDLAGKTHSTYTPVAGDIGHTIVLRIVATNGTGPGPPALSAPTAVVPEVRPVVLRAPSVERATAPVVGTKLGADKGSWTGPPASYAYQWIRCDADGSSNCADVDGQTKSTHRVVAGESGHTLRVRVTASNTIGPGTPATSAPTGVVS